MGAPREASYDLLMRFTVKKTANRPFVAR
jgi:hypothetical protein